MSCFHSSKLHSHSHCPPLYILIIVQRFLHSPSSCFITILYSLSFKYSLTCTLLISQHDSISYTWKSIIMRNHGRSQDTSVGTCAQSAEIRHLAPSASWVDQGIASEYENKSNFLSLVFFRSYYNQERYLWSSTHQVATSTFLNPFFPFSCCGCMISAGFGELAQWGFLSSSAHGAHGHESFMSVQNWISKQDRLLMRISWHD